MSTITPTTNIEEGKQYNDSPSSGDEAPQDEQEGTNSAETKSTSEGTATTSGTHGVTISSSGVLTNSRGQTLQQQSDDTYRWVSGSCGSSSSSSSPSSSSTQQTSRPRVPPFTTDRTPRSSGSQVPLATNTGSQVPPPANLNVTSMLSAMIQAVNNNNWAPSITDVSWACTGNKVNKFFKRYEAFAFSQRWTDSQLALRCQYYCNDSVAESLRTYNSQGGTTWDLVKERLRSLYHKGDEYETAMAEFESMEANMRDNEAANEYLVRFNTYVTSLNEARLDYNRLPHRGGFSELSQIEKTGFFLEKLNALHWKRVNGKFDRFSRMTDIVANMHKRERVQRLENQNARKGLNALISTMSSANPEVQSEFHSLLSSVTSSRQPDQSVSNKLMSVLRGEPTTQTERTLKELTKTWREKLLPATPESDSVGLEAAFQKRLSEELAKEKRKHAMAMKQVRSSIDKQRLENINAGPSPLAVLRTSAAEGRPPLPTCLACRSPRNDHTMYQCPLWCHSCGGDHSHDDCQADWKDMKCNHCSGKHATKACITNMTGIPGYIDNIRKGRERREKERLQKRKNSQRDDRDKDNNMREPEKRHTKRLRSVSRSRRRPRDETSRDRGRDNGTRNSNKRSKPQGELKKALALLNGLVADR